MLLRRSILSYLIATKVIKILLYHARFNQVALRLKSLRSIIIKANNNIENTYTTIKLPLILILKYILMWRPKSFILANFLLQLCLISSYIINDNKKSLSKSFNTIISSYIINANKLSNYYEMNTRRSYMIFSKSQLHSRLLWC